MVNKPSAAQYRVYKALARLLKRPYKPSLSDIGKASKIPEQTAYAHLCALRDLGIVTWDSTKKCSYEILEVL